MGDDQRIQPEGPRERVERLTRDDLRPQLRQESLVALGKLDIEVVRGDGFDHRVAQEFEPLVVDLAAVVQYQRS